MLKKSNLLFYFLSLINFFFGGLFYAGITDAGKGEGLAAGAIVLSYGIISAFIALIISIVVANYLKPNYIITANKCLLVCLLIFFIVIAVLILSK